MPKTTVFGGKEVDYVEVHEEPLHRRQFSNEYCWIYIAGIGPGETSLWHRHSANTFYVCVQHACAALNRPSDKEPYLHHASPGDVWWALSKNAPYVHQVCAPPENSHRSHFFAMEILKAPPVCSSQPLSQPCYRLRPDDSREGIARVYDLKLAPGEGTGSHRLGFSGIVLCLESGGEGSIEADAVGDPFHDGVLSKVGGWKWIDGPVEVNARNTSDRAYVAIVVEWLREGDAVAGSSRL